MKTDKEKRLFVECSVEEMTHQACDKDELPGDYDTTMFALKPYIPQHQEVKKPTMKSNPGLISNKRIVTITTNIGDKKYTVEANVLYHLYDTDGSEIILLKTPRREDIDIYNNPLQPL